MCKATYNPTQKTAIPLWQPYCLLLATLHGYCYCGNKQQATSKKRETLNKQTNKQKQEDLEGFFKSINAKGKKKWVKEAQSTFLEQ